MYVFWMLFFFFFLAMVSCGLVFPYVHLYLLLYHPVSLKFFLLLSVVFSLSERQLCNLLNSVFSCFLNHLLFLLIYTPYFLPYLYNFLLSKFFTFLFFWHSPPWDKDVAKKWSYLKTSAHSILFSFLKEPASQGDHYLWCTLHINTRTNYRCYAQNPYFHCINEAQSFA